MADETTMILDAARHVIQHDNTPERVTAQAIAQHMVLERKWHEPISPADLAAKVTAVLQTNAGFNFDQAAGGWGLAA